MMGAMRAAVVHRLMLHVGIRLLQMPDVSDDSLVQLEPLLSEHSALADPSVPANLHRIMLIQELYNIAMLPKAEALQAAGDADLDFITDSRLGPLREWDGVFRRFNQRIDSVIDIAQIEDGDTRFREWNALTDEVADAAKSMKPSLIAWVAGMPVSPEHKGEMFAHVNINTFWNYFQAMRIRAAADDQFRVAVALRQYARKHNRLPQQLEELVPEFLTEVPRQSADVPSYSVAGTGFVLGPFHHPTDNTMDLSPELLEIRVDDVGLE